MKSKTPITDELDRKQTAHISSSSNDGAELLCNALGEMTDHACQMEILVHQLARALKNLNEDAAKEICEYEVPSDVKEALEQYERLAAMPNGQKLSHRRTATPQT